jgi:hypothetical protein
MNIIIDNSFRDKYGNGHDRNGIKPRIIALHSTAGGESVPAMLRWMVRDGGIMKNGTKREKDYYDQIGVTHYDIDYDGTIYNTIDTEFWTYGTQAKDDEKAIISIEIMKPDDYNAVLPKDSQYQALAELIHDLMDSFQEINVLRTHDYYRKKLGIAPKPCPGAMEWDRLISLCAVDNVRLYQKGSEEFELSKGSI